MYSVCYFLKRCCKKFDLIFIFLNRVRMTPLTTFKVKPNCFAELFFVISILFKQTDGVPLSVRVHVARTDLVSFICIRSSYSTIQVYLKYVFIIHFKFYHTNSLMKKLLNSLAKLLLLYRPLFLYHVRLLWYVKY